ncbi:MAG TPA: TetR/AcrR family transcriptional regulator [Streptosporangiaceae bacterium]|nr:TetR/AcrR family transcriptional regulator [Streptosporangiaceae bacterium]
MQTADGDGRRTRGEPRERAILSAVVSLLGETGYEAMTMDAVAARAHASKTTIYRRWPGKAELVRAAVDAHITRRVLGTRDARVHDGGTHDGGTHDGGTRDGGTRDGGTRESGTRDAGSLRDDLLAVMNAMPGHLTPEFMAMMSGLVHAMRTDPQLAASLRSLFDRDAVAEHVIGRAVRRGELPAAAAGPLARLVHEVIEAQIFRQLMTGSGLDGAFAVHVVDDIIMPLLAGSTGSAGSTE